MRSFMKNQFTRIFLTLCMIVSVCSIAGIQAEAKDVKSWKELEDGIKTQKAADGLVEYCITNNINADKPISIANGIKVKIKGKVNSITVTRDGKLDNNMFTVEGSGSTLQIGGIIFDGNNKETNGNFVTVKNEASFELLPNTTVQKFISKNNGGAIYNNANTVIYNDTKFDVCTSKKNGNAIYNDEKGILKVHGLNITNAGNDNPDVYQRGKMDFVANTAGKLTKVVVYLPKGMYVENPNSVTISSELDSWGSAKISISDKIKVNDVVISVAKGVDISKITYAFTKGNGFGQSVLMATDSAFIRTNALKSVSIDGDTVIVIGVGENVTLNANVKDDQAYIKTSKWTSDNVDYVTAKAVTKTTCNITGKKATGFEKKQTVRFEATTDSTYASASIYVIVENNPKITIDQCVIGKPSKMTATTYDSRYDTVSYRWMVSKDNGKTWTDIKEAKGSVYTTPNVTAETVNWMYKCVVSIKVDGGCKHLRGLSSNVISLADSTKKDPALTIKNTTAYYTGEAVSATASTANDSALAKSIVYTYYTDQAYTKKTTTANGSKVAGGAPVNAGTYYVVASLKETDKYKAANAKATFTVAKAKNALAVNVKSLKVVAKAKKGSKITITKNLGNLAYTVKSSNTKMVKASKSGSAIVCKGLKTGESTVSITTAGNQNIEPCTVNVTVYVAPKALKLKSAESLKKKKLTIKWKVDKTVTGYDLQYAKDSKFKKNAKILSVPRNKAKKGTGNCSGLKSKTIYYVRMRSYYTAKDGTKVTGAWSKKIKVKIK